MRDSEPGATVLGQHLLPVPVGALLPDRPPDPQVLFSPKTARSATPRPPAAVSLARFDLFRGFPSGQHSDSQPHGVFARSPNRFQNNAVRGKEWGTTDEIEEATS